MPEEKKKCFVIMPISDAEGYDKGHFTRVYEHLIKPAVIEAGFEPVRADDTSKANFIVVDILKQILECEMAICDLSSRNPNVFYELGIRQAFNLKTVLIKDNKTIMPFDIAGIRTLSYSENLRIDEVKKAIPEMAKCIKETYNADNKEVNSLLQLLAIDRPAVLPERITLSQDSSIILKAIEELSKRVDYMQVSTRDSFNKPKLYLVNSYLMKKGAKLYSGELLVGTLESLDEKYIYLKDKDKNLLRYEHNSDFARSLSDEPS